MPKFNRFPEPTFSQVATSSVASAMLFKLLATTPILFALSSSGRFTPSKSSLSFPITID